MNKHDIIVIGGSAGGIEALKDITLWLPIHLPAAVFVVIHFPPYSVSYLSDILTRKGSLPAQLATDGEAIIPGRIYVSVPDYHLTITNGFVRLTREARENHTRPAIDVLFRTAAETYEERVCGVLLSGLLTDGTAGLNDIKRQGGIAIVQDPNTAAFGDMPQSAIRHVPGVDYILSPPDIASTLVHLATRAATKPLSSKKEHTSREPSNGAVSERPEVIVEVDTRDQEAGGRDEMPSIYSCPECGGVLWQINDNGFVRFRCHVGHAFSGESLLQQQSEALESSIWYALRTMIDKGKLARQLAATARTRGHVTSAEHFEAQARTAEHHARVVREFLEVNDDVPALRAVQELK